MIYTSAMKGGGGQIFRGETLMKQKKHLCCCFSLLRSCSFWRRNITTKSSSSLPPLQEKEKEPIAPCKQQQQQQQVVPWLMLSKEDLHEKSRSFFSLDEKQVHKIEFSNTANRSWCSGSSDGWLVMSHKTQGNFLYNPITQQQISLPRHQIISKTGQKEKEEKLDQRLRKLYESNRMYFLDKSIVVSSVPTITNSTSSLSSSSSNSSGSDHDNTVVAVIYERSCKHGFSGIGFCRPVDKEWCNVPFHKYYGDHNYCDGGEENMVPIQGNPEVASVEGEEEEEDEEEPEQKEVAVEEEEEDEDEDGDEDEDESDDDKAYQKYASDIIFYKGAFYVVTGRTTKLGIINISSSSGNNKLKGTVRWPNIQPLKLKKSEKCILNNYYLVESCGELLMVIRIRKENTSRKALGVLKTKKFLVFKLDETGDTLKWVREESLGDQILFLGCNYSKSVSVSDMPGYRGNCIYFTDDSRFLFMRGYSGRVCFRDIGVFFLEDEKIEPIFPKDDYLSYYRKYCSHRKYTPTFITPNPYPSSHMGSVID